MNNLSLIGRTEALFGNDLINYDDDLRSVVSKERFLVIGGAGSIGQAVVTEILSTFSLFFRGAFNAGEFFVYTRIWASVVPRGFPWLEFFESPQDPLQITDRFSLIQDFRHHYKYF